MPVPSERLLAIQYCSKKLKEDGRILWYSMHKDSDYVKKCRPNVKMGDGYYMNSNNRHQTFYRDFEGYEIDCMFLANGLRLDKKFIVSHNHGRLYKKVCEGPLDNILTGTMIREFVAGDISLPAKEKIGINLINEKEGVNGNVPNPDHLKNETLFIKALENLPPGSQTATQYHNLITAICLNLFMPPLKKYSIEEEINEGRKRIDLVLTNNAESGFFKRLITHYQIHAPFIFIECKNYASEIGNEEVDQLNGRMKSKRGKFGILTYRKIKDLQRLTNRCRDTVPDNYIMALSDTDVVKMLQYRLADEDVDEILEEKMEELVLH
jgi:hypothetical protein